ncbi:helix-turn-helix domain-containing protein [bacterium]|nr:helix-turn-helix domain-containing protein [bacterium]
METSTAQTQPLDLLTPPQLARELKTTPQTIGVWHRKGIIPAAVACGRVIRFNRAAVLTALAAHSNQKAAR